MKLRLPENYKEHVKSAQRSQSESRHYGPYEPCLVWSPAYADIKRTCADTIINWRCLSQLGNDLSSSCTMRIFFERLKIVLCQV